LLKQQKIQRNDSNELLIIEEDTTQEALSGSNMRTEKQVSWSNSTSVTESNDLLRKLESIETIVRNIE
jgi:hypothetical protein